MYNVQVQLTKSVLRLAVIELVYVGCQYDRLIYG